eukprot:786803_1
MSLLLFLLLITGISFIFNIYATDISATISNSSGDYYINSVSTPNNFQFDTIACSADHCHLLCDTISGCYKTIINATTAKTLTIQCIEPNSCSATTIISASSSTTIQCNNANACYKSNIIANGITNLDCLNTETSQTNADASCNAVNLTADGSTQINIFCADYDCYNASFYPQSADTMHIQLQQYGGYEMNVYAPDITTSLKIDCQSDHACYKSNIHCPLQADCNINCLSSSSCLNTDIFIPTHQYDTLSLDCNDSLNDSCLFSNINCMNTDGATEFVYSLADSQWKCNNFECCPYSDGNISCNVAEDCAINCSSAICPNKYINAADATSLELYCECQGSYVQCPAEGSCNIICNGDESCSYSIISSQSDAFNLECAAVDSCAYSQILISSIQDTTITCSQVNSCRNMNISFSDLTYSAPPTVLNALSLFCLSTTSCKSLHFGMGYSNLVSTVNLVCNGNSSCDSLLISGENSEIFSLDVDCIGTHLHSCKGVNVFATINNTVDINCAYTASCIDGLFLFDMKPRATANINCNNQYITNQEALGACYGAQFNLSSNSQNNDNFITITCNQYDCVLTTFDTGSIDSVQIFCDSPYSCHKTTIHGTQSSSLLIDCQSDNACYQTEVYCPYQQLNGCVIHCKEYDNVCNSMTIHVPHDSRDDIYGKDYAHNYLELNCPSHDSYVQTPCGDITFGCFTSNSYAYIRSVELYLDEDQSGYICDNTELSYCCPWLYGGTVSCVKNDDCVIDCSESIHCNKTYINGTMAKTLTVNCNQDCSDSIILCPNDGCIVNCIGQSSCHRTEIKYDGTISDGGSVILNCTGGNECESTKLYAINAATIIVDARYKTAVSVHGEYADEIIVFCGGLGTDSNYRIPGGLGCQEFFVYGTYANDIEITVTNSYGFYKSDIYGQYAKSVTIDVINGYAFYESYLHLEEAEEVMINCRSNCRFNNDYGGKDKCKPYGNACWAGHWYLSSKNSVNINCYGWGCGSTGIDITPTNDSTELLSKVNINANGCGMCDSTDECVAAWNIWCKNEWNEYERIDIPECTDVNPWQYSTGDYNTYSVDCGCQNVVSNSQNNYVNAPDDDKCILKDMGTTAGSTDAAFRCKLFIMFAMTFVFYVL